jgi:hypothetical protein
MQHEGLGFGGCTIAAGVEVSTYGAEPNPNWSASTFANTPLAWQDTTRTFRYGWTTAEYRRDYPCGTYPQGYCTNGLFYGNSNWSDNKP